MQFNTGVVAALSVIAAFAIGIAVGVQVTSYRVIKTVSLSEGIQPDSERVQCLEWATRQKWGSPITVEAYQLLCGNAK